MQTRKRDRQVEAMELWDVSPFPSNTLLTLPNLGTSIQFEHRRELALCIHQTHSPNGNPLPAKAKPPPRVKKGVIAHPDEDDDDEGRRQKPRKARMSLMWGQYGW